MPPFIVREASILLMIGHSYRDCGDVYSAARAAWRVDPARANNRLVIAHAGPVPIPGVTRWEVLGVFRPNEWFPAQPEDFPDNQPPAPSRWGFEGTEASCAGLYLGRVVPCRYRTSRNPIRYADPCS